MQGGVMLLGSAENENSQNNMFSAIDAKLKIYKRSAKSSNPELIDFPSSFKHTTEKSVDRITTIKGTDTIQTLADQLLLQRFAPASVLINAEGDILYITGRTGKYLEPAAGKANMNIFAMAREGLQKELPGAIREAKSSPEPVKLHKLIVGTNGGTQIVDITLQLIEKPEAIKGTIMIVFADVADAPRPRKRKSKAGYQNSSIREQELELELQQAHEELQSTREEMQTTQEELKSTNEEMQSTNEELQSTNEELTTSKEEMQSLNEELQTVNNELQCKISDYVAANNDMRNLLNSTDIATLFLDKDLNIRRFTEQTTKLFKLRQTDIGRPFTEIVNKLHYPELTDHAHEVLRTLTFKETEIASNDQQWFTIRIMPYRTVDDRIDGLVITFVDTTQQKKSINDLHELKSNFERSLQNSNIILATCDTELRYTWIFNQQDGFDSNRILGKRDDEIDKNEGTTALMKLKRQVLDTGKPAKETISFPSKEKTVSYHVAAQPIRDIQGEITGVSSCANECVCEKPLAE